MKQKTMRKKKAGRFLTLVLAVAMSLSLSGTPVFAAPAGDDIVVQNEGGEGDPVEMDDVFSESLQQIMEDLKVLLADVQDYIDTLVPELSERISEKIAEAKEAAEEFVADAKEKAEQLLPDTKEKAEQFIADAKEKGEQLVTAVKEKSEALLEKAKETAEQLKQSLTEAKEKAEEFIANAKAAAAEKYAQAKEAAEKIIADVKDKSPEVIEKAKEAAEKVLAEAKEAGEKLLTAAKEKAAGLIATVKEKVPAKIEEVKEVIGKLIEEAKKLIVLKDPVVESEPSGKALTYNKKAQALVTEGECKGGTYYYALGEDPIIAPEYDVDEDIEDTAWSTEVPTAKDKGTYYVWYMIVGNLLYNDTEPVCIISTISQWKKYSKGWRYEMPDESYPQNAWMKIDGKWYFFDEDGYMEENAYREGYYLKKNGAWDGVNKKAGWRKTSTGWWYSLPDGSWLAKTWKKIDGKWYYFHADGYIAECEYVDGYYIGKDGAWDGSKKASWKQDSNGWYYSDTSGWYAKNRTLVIDGKSYTFDAKGYCVNP